MEWHIVTGEYPPHLGGVSDYTYQVSQEFAKAGDQSTSGRPLLIRKSLTSRGRGCMACLVDLAGDGCENSIGGSGLTLARAIY